LPFEFLSGANDVIKISGSHTIVTTHQNEVQTQKSPEFLNQVRKLSAFSEGLNNTSSGYGNLRHACHTWHAKQFLMARRSSMFYISILLWFTQKVYWPWLV